MPDDIQRLGEHELVARYVGGSHFDPDTNQINGSAFERNPKDKDGVSVTRRNFFKRDIEEDRNEIRRIMASRLKLGTTAVFAELHVEHALLVLAEYEQDIYFCANPLEADGDKLSNPAHALLMGFPFKGDQVGSLKSEVAGDKLRKCISGTFPAIL